MLNNGYALVSSWGVKSGLEDADLNRYRKMHSWWVSFLNRIVVSGVCMSMSTSGLGQYGIRPTENTTAFCTIVVAMVYF